MYNICYYVLDTAELADFGKTRSNKMKNKIHFKKRRGGSWVGQAKAIELLTNGKVYVNNVYAQRRVDYTRDILRYISVNAVVFGNDAPRGGKNGDYLQLK